MQLLKKCNSNIARTEEEKQSMIKEMAIHYGNFLTAAGFDWEKDEQTKDTPTRVAKAWINDLIEGCVIEEPSIKTFPNSEGYTGLVCNANIPVKSLCAHHNLVFEGVAHVAYIPGKKKTDKVLGLSKLNREVEFFSRRPTIQESLTKQIHDKINKLCTGNRGVAVVIEAKHGCVGCRGVRHESAMKTSQLSGYFWNNEVGTRQEFFNLINKSRFE